MRNRRAWPYRLRLKLRLEFPDGHERSDKSVGNGCFLEYGREAIVDRFHWCRDSGHSTLDLSSSTGCPSLLGLIIHGLSALGFGLVILDFFPFNGTESLGPSADEVLVLPGSIAGTFVGETRESPYIELAGLFDCGQA